MRTRTKRTYVVWSRARASPFGRRGGNLTTPRLSKRSSRSARPTSEAEIARWGMTYPLEGIPLSEHDSVLMTAEDLGYTDAWTAEVNANDAFTPLAAFAAWTKTTRLGCAIANIYNRTPTLLAQTTSTIADLAEGRFCLGIGTSSPAIVESWNGVPLEKPYTRMRQTLAFLKQALAGEKMAATIGPYNIRGF